MIESNEFTFIASLDPLALYNEEAQRWLSEFRREENWQVARYVFQAMVLFRKHDIATACSLLDTVDARLNSMDEVPLSIVHLLRRWHLSAMAYCHYLNGDLDDAKQCLANARDEIRSALSRDLFLIPIATHCIDFRIQMARIARRQNLWVEARQQIDSMRRIYADNEPFCTLDDGRPIYLSDIRRFYESLPLDAMQREKLRYALDEDFPHAEWIDRLEEQIFALPDFVIPYP